MNIKFKGKYANGIALEKLNNYEKNTYIIKGSTGIGGTTAQLNNTKDNILIISPYTSMVAKKESSRSEYLSNKNYFIYGNSFDRWNNINEIIDSESNIVINCTLDQLVIVYNSYIELFDKLSNFNLFIDEYHAYSSEIEYRKNISIFYDIIFNKWNAPIKLSTATPSYLNFDVPTNINIEYITISREENPTTQLNTYTDKNYVFDFISKNRIAKNPVAIFTNNKKLISEIVNRFKDSNSICALVGNNLKLKLEYFIDSNTDINQNVNNADIVILSSSYFAGYDLTRDMSICIVNEPSKTHTRISPENIVQAYGRVRNEIIENAYIHIDNRKSVTSKRNGALESEIKNMLEFNIKQLNQLNYDITNYFTSDINILKTRLEDFNFNLKIHLDKSKSFYQTSTFKKRLDNLLSYSIESNLKAYYTTKRDLRTKHEGSFTFNQLFERLTAIIIQKIDTKALNKISGRKTLKKRILIDSIYNTVIENHYNFFKDVLNCDLKLATSSKTYNYNFDEVKSLLIDWVWLYSCYNIKKGILNPDIIRTINLYSIIYDFKIYLDCHKVGNYNRTRAVKRKIYKELKRLNILPNENEDYKIQETIKTAFKCIDNEIEFNSNNSNKSYLINLMFDSLIYIYSEASKDSIGKESYNRTYTALTQLPGVLRSVIPFKIVEVDITSANPQFVDSLILTNISMDVYTNIMKSNNCDRDTAKKLYNTYLNNHNFKRSKAITFYKSCGYSNAKAKELSELTSEVERGNFYRKMTEIESLVIYSYANMFCQNINCYRLHDALLIPFYEIYNTNNKLKTNMEIDKNNIEFHIGYFNSNSEFNSNYILEEDNNNSLEKFFREVTKEIEDTILIKRYLNKHLPKSTLKILNKYASNNSQPCEWNF